MDPEVGAVDRDQRLAQIAQGGLAAGPELLLGHHDPHRPAVLHPVEAVDARGVVTDALRRLLGRLDLGDHVAFAPTADTDADVLFVFTPGTARFEYFRLLDRAHRGEAGWELISETQDHFDNHYVESPLWREARGAA